MIIREDRSLGESRPITTDTTKATSIKIILELLLIMIIQILLLIVRTEWSVCTYIFNIGLCGGRIDTVCVKTMLSALIRRVDLFVHISTYNIIADTCVSCWHGY